MSEDSSTHHQLLKKKRVGKACDSCRIKKTKCDGKKPCNRCILDNKICVFTEKKKPKEKKHPLGYVELLETRLDILTKLFEKLIVLSRPHLQFIEDIVSESSSPQQQQEHSPMSSSSTTSSHEDELEIKREHGDEEQDEESQVVVPINKVICYLINQKGLLNNLPVEWEQGAMIAANYDSNNNLEESSKLFADHKLENSHNHSHHNCCNDNNTSPISSPTLPVVKRRNSKKRSLSKQQQQQCIPQVQQFSSNNQHHNSSQPVDQIQVDELSPEDSYFPTDGPFLKKEPISPPLSNQFSNTTNNNSAQHTPGNQNPLSSSEAQFSLTSFNPNFSTSSHDGNISDIDSDSPHKDNSNSVSPQQINDYRTSSLFSNSIGDMPMIGKTSSLTSLTTKYEKHSLSSPQSLSASTTAPSSIFTNADPILATLRRSSSSLSQKAMGSITNGGVMVQKSKNSIHKPHHNNNHSRVSSFDKRLESTNLNSTTNHHANFTFDTRYEELDDSNTTIDAGGVGTVAGGVAGGFNNYIAPPLPQPPSPSDNSLIFNSLGGVHLNVNSSVATTSGGGLDLLVDNSFDPFFSNNNNPFTGKYQMG